MYIFFILNFLLLHLYALYFWLIVSNFWKYLCSSYLDTIFYYYKTKLQCFQWSINVSIKLSKIIPRFPNQEKKEQKKYIVKTPNKEKPSILESEYILKHKQKIKASHSVSCHHPVLRFTTWMGSKTPNWQIPIS